MLSNAYFLAKFRFDTAENEPAKNLQICKFAKFANFDEKAINPFGHMKMMIFGMVGKNIFRFI